MSDQSPKSPSAKAPLVPIFHTVLAAENKTSELFVKNFQYQGENVATKHLGQIFGFFEIPDTHEDNAYIVNFLASVVKKEYFVNPKRSATDAFEAALHKVNLALAELVRQGSTGWLGKLHGVVAVIEQDTFHFSVTGDAAILLYRENQVTLVSEGLADKDAALHPLKTFLEISSGALMLSDKILITSPELFDLCPPELLQKNAFRMDKNGFARFVRAALVNELQLGVSIILDIDKPATLPIKAKKSKVLREESLEKLQNVFSAGSFQEEATASEPNELAEEIPEEVPAEYTDTKTGHIYVQGELQEFDTSEPPAWQTFYADKVAPMFKAIQTSLRRFSKKSRKSAVRSAGVITQESKEVSQKMWQTSRDTSVRLAKRGNQALKNRVASLRKPALENPDIMVSESSVAEEEQEYLVALPPDTPLENLHLEETPDAMTPESKRQKSLEKFSLGYNRPPRKTLAEKVGFNSTLENVLSFFRSLPLAFKRIFRLFLNLSPKKKTLVLLAFLLILTPVFYSLFRGTAEQGATTEVTETEAPIEDTPLQSEPAPPALDDQRVALTWSEGPALLTVTNDNSLITITPKSVIIDGKSINFPADGTIQSATYMPDLKIVFLWSTNRELVAWNTVDQKFTANVFPLASGVNVGGLYSYLTYLYVLDKGNGAIYRFARIEGGFTEPTTWLKTSLPKNSAQSFVVSENIRIALENSVDQYLQGNKEKTISEGKYNVLGLSRERNLTLGVNTESGKLTVWNIEGGQVYENTFEELKGITAITYDESDKKLFVSKDQNTLEYSLNW